MAEDRVEWGFQVPERERWRPGEAIPTETREQAERFVSSHPGCEVVSRRVIITDWLPNTGAIWTDQDGIEHSLV